MSVALAAPTPAASRTVSVYEAKTHLSALLDAVESGEAITITKHGKPVARLQPIVAGEMTRGGAISMIRRSSQGNRLGPDLSLEDLLAADDAEKRF